MTIVEGVVMKAPYRDTADHRIQVSGPDPMAMARNECKELSA
jgi:hypothetical protein